MVPTLVHGIFVAVRIVDRGFEDFNILYKVFLGIFVFGVLVMSLCMFLFVRVVEGVVMICCFLVLIWFAIQGYSYAKNDFYIRPLWQVINVILAFLVVISAAVVSIFKDDLASYAGVSFSLMTLLLVFWLYALM